MIARLIASVLVTSENGVLAVALLALSAAILIGLMISARTRSTTASLVFLTGLCFGPIFPTIVGITFSKIDPGHNQVWFLG